MFVCLYILALHEISDLSRVYLDGWMDGRMNEWMVNIHLGKLETHKIT